MMFIGVCVLFVFLAHSAKQQRLICSCDIRMRSTVAEDLNRVHPGSYLIFNEQSVRFSLRISWGTFCRAYKEHLGKYLKEHPKEHTEST